MRRVGVSAWVTLLCALASLASWHLYIVELRRAERAEAWNAILEQRCNAVPSGTGFVH